MDRATCGNVFDTVVAPIGERTVVRSVAARACDRGRAANDLDPAQKDAAAEHAGALRSTPRCGLVVLVQGRTQRGGLIAAYVGNGFRDRGDRAEGKDPRVVRLVPAPHSGCQATMTT